MVKRIDTRAARAKRYGWSICASSSSGLVYEKEVIPEGEWAKLNREGKGIQFETYRSTLQHWAKSVGELLAAGVKPVLAKSHDHWDKPEEKLGEIVGAEVRKNRKGRDALFARVRFDDDESKAIALKGDVSIGSPDVWYDGRGKKWNYPFQHLASTNSPVIPGLEKWQAIAASFGTASKGNTMDLDELIALLGIEVPEDANTDEAKKALIQAKLKELSGGGAPAPEAEPVEGEPVEASQTATGVASPNVGKGAARKVSATVSFSKENPPPPLVVKSIGEGRKATIEGKVAQHKFAPAVAADLIASFCSAERVSLELCHGDDGREFDLALSIAEKSAANPPLAKHGRSAASDDSDDAVLELAHNSGRKESPLVTNAKARAAQAAK